MKNHQFLLYLMFFALWSGLSLNASAEPQNNIEGLVVAEIAEDTITQAELQTELQRHFKQHLADLNESQIRLLQKRILKRMIERRMLIHAAQQKGLYPDQQHAETQLQEWLKQDNTPDSFSSYMKAQGISRDDFLRGLRDDLAVSSYIEQEVFRHITVSEDAARQAFHNDPAPYTNPEEIRARHILIKTHPQMSAEEVAERLELTQNLLEQVQRSDADFAQIAKDHSHGPGRSKGGDLGYFTKNQLDPIFTNAAFALQTGETSEIIQTKHGFHIIKIEDRRGGIQPDFEEVKKQAQKKLLERQKLQALELHLSKLTQESKVIIYMHWFGARMAAVDFDGQAAFESWTSATDMNTEKINEFFPNLVGGCDALESFLQKLNG